MGAGLLSSLAAATHRLSFMMDIKGRINFYMIQHRKLYILLQSSDNKENDDVSGYAAGIFAPGRIRLFPGLSDDTGKREAEFFPEVAG